VQADADQRLGDILRTRRELIAHRAVGLLRGERPWTLDKARRGIDALIEWTTSGRCEALLALDPEPIASADLVRNLVLAALPAVVGEPDAVSLVGQLVEVASEIALVAAGTHGEGQQEERGAGRLGDPRTDLLRLTTHELRRPVSMTRGYLDMIQQGSFGEVPEALRSPLEQMTASNQEMARLLNSLSAVARLETEARTPHRRPCSLAVLVREAVEVVLPEARMKAIEIVPQIELHRSANVDRERLRIAIINLLSNAVKYSSPSTRVEIRLRGQDRQALLSVADQGPGIDAEDEGRVFDPYYRSERSRAAGIPGMGLGLYLVRQIAELHGGQVSLVHRPAGGATFVLRIPLDQESPPGSGERDLS
jgi:signal transduction histidine kinase